MGGLLLSLVWMLVLRYSAGLLAWLVVLIVNILFVACTLLAFTKVRSWLSGSISWSLTARFVMLVYTRCHQASLLCFWHGYLSRRHAGHIQSSIVSVMAAAVWHAGHLGQRGRLHSRAAAQ